MCGLNAEARPLHYLGMVADKLARLIKRRAEFDAAECSHGEAAWRCDAWKFAGRIF